VIVEPLKQPPQKLADIERKYIIRVLAHFGWNQKQAHEALGISYRGLRLKIQEFRKQGFDIPACTSETYRPKGYRSSKGSQ
jgi:DNA-binding NtrC family response regulator